MRPFTTRPELRGTFGMVASTHWLASAAGMAVLERGGNAFDAAAAAGFTLQVVEPHLNGPGGDLPVLVYSAADTQVHVLCGQGPAPAGATIEEFRRRGLDMVPGAGMLAACVPGAFGAWLLLLERFGTWPLQDVLEFAIGYAENGFPIAPRVCEAIGVAEPRFQSDWTESASIWLPGGRIPVPGELFRHPMLARTYRRLAGESAAGTREAGIESARRAWYEGFVAEAVDREARRRDALIRADDLAAWRASLEPPVAVDYRGCRVFKPGPWTQGPVFLQQLALLAGLDLAALDTSGADFVHLVIECAKLAFADREAWYGDPRFAPDLTAELLDPGYNDRRRGLVGDEASLELRPGSPGGRTPRVRRAGDPALASGGALGDPTFDPLRVYRGDTCHVDVGDRWGNLVSATPSGGWLQSSPAIPGLGFCLGTRAQVLDLEPGHPNSLEPGKRPRTTLSPTLAFRDGDPYLAFGTPGADRQDQWSLHFFLRHVEHGLNLQEAIDQPAFHTLHFPNSFYPHHMLPGRLVLEDAFRGSVVSELRRRGHDVEVVPAWSQGRLSAVANDRRTGLLLAAADPRRMQGYAVGR